MIIKPEKSHFVISCKFDGVVHSYWGGGITNFSSSQLNNLGKDMSGFLSVRHLDGRLLNVWVDREKKKDFMYFMEHFMSDVIKQCNIKKYKDIVQENKPASCDNLLVFLYVPEASKFYCGLSDSEVLVPAIHFLNDNEVRIDYS